MTWRRQVIFQILGVSMYARPKERCRYFYVSYKLPGFKVADRPIMLVKVWSARESWCARLADGRERSRNRGLEKNEKQTGSWHNMPIPSGPSCLIRSLKEKIDVNKSSWADTLERKTDILKIAFLFQTSQRQNTLPPTSEFLAGTRNNARKSYRNRITRHSSLECSQSRGWLSKHFLA